MEVDSVGNGRRGGARKNAPAENAQAEGLVQMQSRLAEALAHDVRGPLNALSLYLHVLDERLRGEGAAPSASVTRPIAAMREQVGRIDQLLRHFLQFSSPPMELVATSSFDLAQLVAQSLELCGYHARRGGVVLDTALEPVQARGSAGAIGQAVTSLLVASVTNGRDALVKVSVGRREASAVLRLAGSIAPPGSREPEPAAPEAARVARRLIESARGIIESQQGALSAREAPEGSEVEVVLPLAETSAS